MDLQHPWTFSLAEIWDKWHRCFTDPEDFFFPIIIIIFLWQTHLVAPTVKRQTANVSVLRGLRASERVRQGQSPEMADWGTSGKDGGEICRLQLLPPQPNVPWETGLHTQQCCGTENKRGLVGGGTSPPPSSVSLAGATSSVIHFIWSQPGSLWTHCTVFTNTGRSVLLARLLLRACARACQPVRRLHRCGWTLGASCWRGGSARCPPDTAFIGSDRSSLCSCLCVTSLLLCSPTLPSFNHPILFIFIPHLCSFFSRFNFSLSSNSLCSCCGCSCARLGLVVQGGGGGLAPLAGRRLERWKWREQGWKRRSKNSNSVQLLKTNNKTGSGFDFSFPHKIFFSSLFQYCEQSVPGILCCRHQAEMYSFCLCSVHMVKDAQNASAIFMHIARCAPCFQQSTVWTVSLLDSLFAWRHRQRWLRAEEMTPSEERE